MNKIVPSNKPLHKGRQRNRLRLYAAKMWVEEPLVVDQRGCKYQAPGNDIAE